MLKDKDPKTISLFAIGIWVIWSNRNRGAHGNSIWSIEQCCLKVHYYLDQFDTRHSIGGRSVCEEDLELRRQGGMEVLQ